MSKTIRKIITGTLAAMSTVSIATPVMASTMDIDTLYKNAYDAMKKAQETESQADINAAMELIWELRHVGDENKDSNLINSACTWSSLVDKVQHPKLVKIVDAITKAQETGKQADINAAFATIEPELPVVWRSSYTSAIDLVQQKLQSKLVAAVERAEANRTEESIKAARELVNELLTSKDSAIINWVRVYEGRLNIIVGDGSADDDYLIDGDNHHKPGHGEHVDINKPVTPDTLGPEGGVMPTLPGDNDIINQPVTPDTLGPEGGVMPTLPGGNGGVSVDDPNIDPGFTVDEGVSVDDPNIDDDFLIDNTTSGDGSDDDNMGLGWK